MPRNASRLPDNVFGNGETLPTSAGPSDLVKYVLVTLEVSREDHETFQEKMLELTERMYEYKRWELVFAAYPITGEVNRFVHIWKIPDESTIIEIMRQGALRPTLPDRERISRRALVEYDFRSTYEQVQNLVSNTAHTLLTSLSYDPENIGHQTQTVLIDVNEQPYLIYHRDLRVRGTGLTKLNGELDKVRMRDDLRRHGEEIAAAEPDAYIEAIQQLLNRGVTDATLHKDRARDLLFNLAGLRPKTIFEDLKAVTEIDDRAEHAALAAPPPSDRLAFPTGVQHLLLAMPDGNVYQADEAQVRAIAKGVPASKLQRTRELVKMFVDCRIPLASIPNQRNEVVGDGCACYVINLSSFSRH